MGDQGVAGQSLGSGANPLLWSRKTYLAVTPGRILGAKMREEEDEKEVPSLGVQGPRGWRVSKLFFSPLPTPSRLPEHFNLRAHLKSREGGRRVSLTQELCPPSSTDSSHDSPPKKP